MRLSGGSFDSDRLAMTARFPGWCNDIGHGRTLQQAGRCQGKAAIALVDLVHHLVTGIEMISDGCEQRLTQTMIGIGLAAVDDSNLGR